MLQCIPRFGSLIALQVSSSKAYGTIRIIQICIKHSNLLPFIGTNRQKKQLYIWRLKRGGRDERRSTVWTVQYRAPYSTVPESPFLGYVSEPENCGQTHGTVLFPELPISQDQNWERKEAHQMTSEPTVFPSFFFGSLSPW